MTVNRVMGGEEACEGLSPLGRQQAERLRDRFASGSEPAVDALWSSTMPRAEETAQIIAPGLGDLPITRDPDLVEWRPGEADGLLFVDYREKYGPRDLYGRPWTPLAPGGESKTEFQFRTTRGFERILEQHRGQTVAVACHGGVVDIAFRYFLDLPRKGAFHLHTLNTSITEFVVDDFGDERGPWRLARYNDSAHLAGLPAETERA